MTEITRGYSKQRNSHIVNLITHNTEKLFIITSAMTALGYLGTLANYLLHQPNSQLMSSILIFMPIVNAMLFLAGRTLRENFNNKAITAFCEWYSKVSETLVPRAEQPEFQTLVGQQQPGIRN